MKIKGFPIQLSLLGALLLSLPAIGHAQFTFITNADNTITITGYTGTNNVVTIPGIINSLPVTAIGSNAFTSFFSLFSVSIPDSVKDIGYDAFGGTFLSGIVIPDNVINIASSAFAGCVWMTNVTMGSNVTTIGDTAFVDCRGLTNIEIPNSVTSIGNDAFENCSGLMTITIPDSVTNIGIAALWGCASMTSAKLPNSINNFGDEAFFDCYSLTNVILRSGATNIGNSAFFNCQSLPGIRIPDSVTSIAYESFDGCSSLANITIPAAVTNIGDAAFGGCTNLDGAFFSGNAPGSVGSFSFGGDYKMTAYYLPGTTGWDEFGTTTGIPVVLWNPQAQTGDGKFGVGTNGFGFNIAGTTNIPIVVEAASNLAGPWTTAQSCTLTNGQIYFSDPQWTNYHTRFYRIRSP